MVERRHGGRAPRGAWAGVAQAGAFGHAGAPGVTARLREGFALANLTAPSGGADALAQAVRDRLGLSLPRTPRVVGEAAHALIWAGPAQWLLRGEGTRAHFAALLEGLAPYAAVSDQSCARAAMQIGGPRARDALAKGAMLDLDPRVFAVGDVAMTMIAHVNVHLWRAPDTEAGAVFEVLVPRSFAGSFWSWFAASAAEFGCRVERDAA